MSWWNQLVTSSSPVITDGAWGTQLQARGLQLGEFPDAWNLTHPDRVLEVAKLYVDAGSDIILTNTFGATQPRLAEAGLENDAAEINRLGAQISRSAAQNHARVFGSIGPSGKMLLTGDITPDTLLKAFTEQAQALAEGGVDALVIETMSDPEEARIAITAAKTTSLPIVACMVFDAGKNKDRTMMGNTPEQIAAILTEAGANAIGSNCGQGIANFIPLTQRLKSATHLPIWIKANAGLPEMINGQVTYNTSPQQFASHYSALQQAGATFIGGCCGTNPLFIQALLQSRQPPTPTHDP